MLKKLLFLCCFCISGSGLVWSQQLQSPNGEFVMEFALSEDGTPTYRLSYKGKEIIRPGRLGFELKGEGPSLLKDFKVQGTDTDTFDETWAPVWGEEAEIRNHYNELLVHLEQSGSGYKMDLRFRLFDDGLGFRYEFPEQRELVYFVIAEERTEFAMTGIIPPFGSRAITIARNTTIPNRDSPRSGASSPPP